MKTKFSIIALFIMISVYSQGVLTPVDKLKIRMPASMPTASEVIVRNSSSGETGTILKTDLVDVIEAANASVLPATGNIGKIYCTLDNNKLFRWNGTIYVEISPVSGTDIKTLEGQSLLGSGNIDLVKADVGLSNVDNTSDVNKPISTATQTALDLKENSFAKNTAFNKNFGTAAGTVVEGNDSRLSDARTPLSHTLDSHSNVTITTNSNGEILKWNGTAWVNNTLVEAGIQPAGTYATGGGSATGTNTGDNAVNSLYSGLVTNATHTGDVTGATALTLATVNSNVGTFGNASNSTTQTVNAKGLTTAISNVPIQIAKSQVTELVSDLATKENVANKSDSYTTSSSTTYASTKAVVDGLATKISGTGTINTIPKFTASGTIGNSQIIDNGTNVLIGTTTDNGVDKLQVNGSGRFNGEVSVGTYRKITLGYATGETYIHIFDNTYGDYGYKFKNSANTNVGGFGITSLNDDVKFYYIGDGYGDQKFQIINSTGNVLINTATDNGVDKLQVNGSISATSYTGSATLTGIPTAPTATAGTNTTQIATTAFVQAVDANVLHKTGEETIGLGEKYFTDNVNFTSIAVSGQAIGRAAVSPNEFVIKSQLNLKADLASPIFTGTPTAPTAAPGTTGNQIATLDYVQAADAGNVKLTGDQTISGTKTFISPISSPQVSVTGGPILLTGASNTGLSSPNNGGAVFQTQVGVSGWTSNLPITAPTPTLGGHLANKGYVDGLISALPTHADVVHKSGTETIGGSKTFSLPVMVPNGTTSSEAVNKGQLDAQKPYKVYTALLTQTGTNAPTATVLENTLGGTVVWTRTSTGTYAGTLSGAFLVNKSIAFVTGIGFNKFIGCQRLNDNVMQITSVDTANSPADTTLISTTIEIRVYN